ncbi:MAG: sulfite exporter TauE/SafE family protein [Pirellulales bacterium]
MLELPLVFLGGLLGSAHCVGMCGGFALLIGSGVRSVHSNVARQAIYSLGRIFTYVVLGGALGYAGLRLAQDLPLVVRAQSVLALVAGATLVVVGLISAGVLPRRLPTVLRRWGSTSSTPGPSCLATGLLGSFLRAPGWSNVFLAGVFTGFLPCGLVYGFLALACSTASFPLGAATMAAFGLGTVPLMVLVGSGGSLMSVVTRQRLLRVAAWCVVIAGMISLARGVSAWTADTQAGAPDCPLCAQES